MVDSSLASQFDHVDFLWDDSVAASLAGDALALLVYRSNLLGTDQRITNTGGGNTSSKSLAPDPLSREAVEIMHVKGSGGDLRTSKAENFASLYMDKLRLLVDIYQKHPEKGAKTPIEDQMVGMYLHSVYNLNARASSIDTPLHAFVPYAEVDHTHPNAVIAIAACEDQERLTQEVFGGDIGWLSWQRPGFDLGLKLGELATKNPQYKGAILGQHGLINWANDAKSCYILSLELIEKASRYLAAYDKGEVTFGGQRYQSLSEADREALLKRLLPKLRHMVSRHEGKLHKMVATVQSDEDTLRFVNSYDAPRLAELGTSCPDHFLRTKIKPLYVDWDPKGSFEDLVEGLEPLLTHYRQDYAAYYEACKHPDSPAMRNPNPTVILIPGVGMIAWGKNKSESRVTAEFYNCAIEVMKGAEAVSRYVALPRQEAFDIEYWLLEEAKLKRMPPEQEFSRAVVVVVGAGSGIGKAIAERFATEGAHVVCADLNLDAAKATADLLLNRHGMGVGVAGTGISACGPAIALSVDITKRESVQAMFDQVILAYGGIDHVLVTAGIFATPDTTGRVSEAMWSLTFDVNVKGAYHVADEAGKIWREQGLPGTLVITTSANAVVSKKGSLAYDTSKAAANHLVRELAIELSPLVRVNALAPATVVEGSAMFPRERVISSLRKYAIPFDEYEATEDLRQKLAQFYAERTLTKSPITLADQVEAAYLLSSQKLSKTTGQVLTVDGGLIEAFMR
ncbi:MAG: bifunctional rhamnulose-1-phosphate aldolase/short-chain dehydrogenase [Deinococcales bacterium]